MSTPNDVLAQINRRYPGLFAQAESWIRQRGRNGFPGWSPWCLLPLGGWYTLLGASLGTRSLTADQIPELARVAALGAWRLTQGVYRYAPELLASLLDTPLDGELPSEALMRLPEWCVYVELSAESGFWAHLEEDANTGGVELRLLIRAGADTIPLVIHVGDWTLEEAVRRATATARRGAERHDLPLPLLTPGAAGDLVDGVRQIVSLLLYLCSDAPDVRGHQPGDYAPRRALPARGKNGRWVIPSGATVWRVGESIGSEIRDARENAERRTLPDGRAAPRPHIRRAHWHGFWRGAKTDNATREYFVRWIPPLFVGGDK